MFCYFSPTHCTIPVPWFSLVLIIFITYCWRIIMSQVCGKILINANFTFRFFSVYTYINNYMQLWSYRFFFNPKAKTPQSLSLGWKHQLGQMESENCTIQKWDNSTYHWEEQTKENSVVWSLSQKLSLGFIKCLNSNYQRDNKNVLLLVTLLGLRW